MFVEIFGFSVDGFKKKYFYWNVKIQSNSDVQKKSSE